MTVDDIALLPVPLVVQPPGGTVQISRHHDIAVVTLDHSATRHALSPALLGDLGTAVATVADSNAKALVLTATGKVFSAGGDLQGLARVLESTEAGPARDRRIEALVDQLHQVIRNLRALPIPVIAAVNGAAVGAGISLAMTADVRVVTDRASFIPGYLAVGATPDGGASYHLGKALGARQALSAFLLNRRLDAQELRDVGLAGLVVDETQDVLREAIGIASVLSRLSAVSLAGIRRLTEGATGRGFDDHLDAEKRWFVQVSRTPEFTAAMAAFGGKPSTAATPIAT